MAEGEALAPPDAMHGGTADTPRVLADDPAPRFGGQPLVAFRGRLSRHRRVILLGSALVGCAAVAAFAACLMLGLRAPMPISRIAVDGASQDLQPPILAALQAAPGQSFRSVDALAATDRILAIEGIAGVELDWAWWATLRVAVTEQVPVAAVPLAAGGYRVVDAQGATIRFVPKLPVGLLLLETGSSSGRAAALAVGQRIPDSLRKAVVAVVARGARSVDLRLRNGVTAQLGTPTDIDRKLLLVSQLLPSGARSINVSVPDRPALKGLAEGAVHSRPAKP